MGFIKRTNKKFDYKPRYYKGEGNPYQIEHKFDEFRSTVGKNKNLKTRFRTAYDDLKESKGINKTILTVALVLVFMFLYIIDFDLSIFYSKN